MRHVKREVLLSGNAKERHVPDAWHSIDQQTSFKTLTVAINVLVKSRRSWSGLWADSRCCSSYIPGALLGQQQ